MIVSNKSYDGTFCNNHEQKNSLLYSKRCNLSEKTQKCSLLIIINTCSCMIFGAFRTDRSSFTPSDPDTALSLPSSVSLALAYLPPLSSLRPSLRPISFQDPPPPKKKTPPPSAPPPQPQLPAHLSSATPSHPASPRLYVHEFGI